MNTLQAPESSFTTSPRGTTRPFFLELLLQLRVLEAAQVHQCSKVNSPLLFCCLFDDIFLALDVRYLPCRQLFELFPLLINCGFRTCDFHFLPYGYNFVHKIMITQRLEPLLSNVIFMIFSLSLFSALSRGVVGFYDTCVSCPLSARIVGATSLLSTN